MVSTNLTQHYDRMMLILEPTPQAPALARKQVEVVNYPDGRFAVRHEGIHLPYRLLDKIAVVKPGAIVENERLGSPSRNGRRTGTSDPSTLQPE